MRLPPGCKPHFVLKAMNPPRLNEVPLQADAGRSFSTRWIVILLGISLMAGLLAVSQESLWIDEGCSAFYATQPDFGSLADAMKRETGSDAQVPFYVAYLWAWDKGFGHGEWTLRAANLPWLLLGNAALLFSMRRAGVRRGVATLFILAAALSPFLSFYLNQARCYTMQYATACMVLAYLMEVSADPGRAFQWAPLMTGVAGALLLCGTSLTAVVWDGSAFLAVGWMIGKGPEIPRPSPMAWALLGITGAGLALLGLYYLETLLRGVRATGGETTAGTVLYCLYEMAGLAGLGPARNDLRGEGLGVLKAYGVPLALGAAAIGGSLVAGALAWIRRNPGTDARRWALAFALLPLAFMLGTGVLVHFRVLGRHLIAVYPLALFLVALALDALWGTRGRWGVILFLAAWAVSSGRLRFSDAHHRDDYRSASALAGKGLASGESVWWVADQRTAAYYGLDQIPKGNLTYWMNAMPGDLAQKPEPDRIFISKKEVYDSGHGIEQYIASHQFVPCDSFSVFTVFAKKP